MLSNNLDFQDGLLIATAQRLKVPFVTSERKAENWKKTYEGVKSITEFW
jgi:predicted nucleic acid-binding protein